MPGRANEPMGPSATEIYARIGTLLSKTSSVSAELPTGTHHLQFNCMQPADCTSAAFGVRSRILFQMA